MRFKKLIHLSLIAVFIGLAPSKGFSSSAATLVACRQVHSEISWLDQSLNHEQAQRIKSLSSSWVNNETEGYHLLKSLPIGESHIGLGGDFNYTVMASAKSSGGVIYDIDPGVIAFHQMMRAAFLMTETPSQLIQLFREISEKGSESKRLHQLRSQISAHITEAQIIDFLKDGEVAKYLAEKAAAVDSKGVAYTYLGDLKKFEHIRQLFRADKIRFVLKSQYDPHALRDMTQAIHASSIGTIYISNSLEFRWLDVGGGPGAAMERSMIKMFGDITGLPKALNELDYLIQTQAEDASSYIYRSLSVTRMSLNSLKRAESSWNQFWKNMKEVPWSKQAVMLTTSRDLELFGASYKEVKTEHGQDPKFNWYYAVLPHSLWFRPQMLQSASDFVHKMTLRRQEIGNRFIETLSPEAAAQLRAALEAGQF